MNQPLFNDREHAGGLLAVRLREHGVADFEKPLVLAIPRGGVEVGVALARGLGAELDVVLSRKLRSPHQPELALGAVSETGEVHLNPFAASCAGKTSIEAERQRQMAEIERRKVMFRAVRPQAPIEGRSVIVTDDGIATGATMIAALHTVRAANPREIIVATPVSAPDRLDEIRPLCQRIECLCEPIDFLSVGQFYRDFEQVSDERVVELLREYGTSKRKRARGVA